MEYLYKEIKKKYSNKYFVCNVFYLKNIQDLSSKSCISFVPDTPSVFPKVDLIFINGDDGVKKDKLLNWSEFYSLIEQNCEKKNSSIFLFNGKIDINNFRDIIALNSLTLSDFIFEKKD